MTTRLKEMIEKGMIGGNDMQYVDAFRQTTQKDTCGTLTTRTALNGHCYVTMPVEGEDEQTVVQNAAADGCATTLTTAHHYSGNIVNPKRGQTEMGVLEILNPDKDGAARTITTHYPDMNAKSVTSKRCDGYGRIRTAVKTSAFRIRKLTERECFRLMGVSETDIDKIQAAGISRSQQYKLAGNSIVVDVLAEIFRKMFIDTRDEAQQLSLF